VETEKEGKNERDLYAHCPTGDHTINETALSGFHLTHALWSIWALTKRAACCVLRAANHSDATKSHSRRRLLFTPGHGPRRVLLAMSGIGSRCRPSGWVRVHVQDDYGS
jgi:hypothetical protein